MALPEGSNYKALVNQANASISNDVDRVVSEMQNWLTRDMQTKSDFLDEFENEDDWTFVIKSHALIEAAVSQMIVEVLGDSRLSNFTQPLNFGGRSGKLALAKSLELLDNKQSHFIEWFSKLRNDLVHKIENIRFTFEKHLAAFDKRKMQEWKRELLYFEKNPKVLKLLDHMAEKTPKRLLSANVFRIVVHCSGESATAKSRRQTKSLFGYISDSAPIDSKQPNP